MGDLQGDDISDGQPGSVDELPRVCPNFVNLSVVLHSLYSRPLVLLYFLGVFI